ncbi:hypothetical protein LSH36_46g00030 [Paralvinella palmiformis]|uniref:Uncharacterized protein n=1 Tax=Paralvinella palmiformis TaxID=53620 RepID=A0AAD9ND69_9ANNE|nr:hypothetical protein LSH36_46g00030 [Paralvinella palmiformis]
MEPVEVAGFGDISRFCKNHPIVIASALVTGSVLVALRRYFAGGVCHSKVLLNGKTVIITGANVGIGRETAKDLARRGARVILACRDLTKAERAADAIRKATGNENVLVQVVDLASLSSVRKFCDKIVNSESRLDVLINNAGIMACPHWKSEDGYEFQLAVNHLGHFLLTNLLLDLMKKTEGSRIINLSSLAHRTGKIHFDDINLEKDYMPFKAYAQSKLANVLFTKELHRRLQGTSVTTYAVHPGVVRTELGRYMMANKPKWHVLYRYPLIYFIFKTPYQGAQTTLYCTLTEGLEAKSGKYFSDCAEKEAAPQANDPEAASRLWSLSSQMVGLSSS